MPKVYAYRPGDYVYMVNHEDKIPGGATGIRVRAEILKVVKLGPSGTLELMNQAGRVFQTHKERVVPCLLPNVEGTTHPGLRPYNRMKACVACGDHRRGTKMLLCDNCDAGYHTYCLVPPLDEIPPGNWLCPVCIANGVTHEQVLFRQGKYIKSPFSRPNLELPSPKRRRHAAALAKEWHGAVVYHKVGPIERYGRLVYQGVLAEKWFRIYWNDDTTSEHDTRMLKQLLKVDEANAPQNVMAHPGPYNVMYLVEANDLRPFFCVHDPSDLQRTLNTFMPECHSRESVEHMFRCCQVPFRTRNKCVSPPGVLDALFAALDFRAVKTVLDPWAENPAVSNRFADFTSNTFVANVHTWRKGQKPLVPKNVKALSFNPLEAHLYEHVARAVDLDACVMIPPESLLDLALVTALYHAHTMVCMYVPVSYVSQATWQRMDFFMHCEAQERILTVTARSDPSHCWLCVFHASAALRCMIRDGVDHSLRWVVVDA
jgi:hypothetical protein